MTALIGVDVGTTRVKAVAYDHDGGLLAAADHPSPWVDTAFGVEMHAADLDAAVAAVLSGVCEALGGRKVDALGVTGMAESGVLTDADGRVLAPIRAWHNLRGDVDPIRSRCAPGEFEAATGLPLMAQWSLPKILQQRSDYPATIAAVRFDSIPEWVVRRVGGATISEASLAGRTGMVDVLTGRVWPVAVEILGADMIAEPQDAQAPCGRADGAIHAALAGAVLAVGGHDHQCAAFASGATNDETLFDSMGTAEALTRMTGEHLDRDRVRALVGAGLTVGRTVVPGRICVLAGLPTGMCLERAAAQLGATDRTTRESLANDPTWAAQVAAAIAPAGPLLAAISNAVGPHRRVLAAGGWFHDAAVLRAKRRQLGGLDRAVVDEAGTAGAAYLAGAAAGALAPPDQLTGPPWPGLLHLQGDHS